MSQNIGKYNTHYNLPINIYNDLLICYNQGLNVEHVFFLKNDFLLSWQFVSLSSTNIADYKFDVKRELWCEFTLQVRAF